MASGGNKRQFGAFLGTGAEQTITLGYQPRAVIVTNLDDGSEVRVDEFMAGGSTVAKRGGLKINGADGVRSFLAAAAGIVLTSSGFTVGTDDACNEDAIQMVYEATD